MRVVAGRVGGRKLVSPRGDLIRPTTDRVREAMFNALDSMGAVADAVAVDLFAGSGALGIEALSRGAASVDFVESTNEAIAIIEQNLRTLDLLETATVRATTVERALSLLPEPIDLVLADPPYDFEAWDGLLRALVPKLAADAVVVLESDRDVPLPPGLEKTRSKAYGGTVVTFAQPVDESHRTGADV